MAAGDAAAERAALADEVFLADELLERSRPHPCGQRLTLGRWLEEGFGSGPARARMACRGSAGRHAARWCATARGQRLEEPDPGDLDDGPGAEQERDQRATDERDPLDVTRHVGVLSAGGRGEARRPAGSRERTRCAGFGLRAASAAFSSATICASSSAARARSASVSELPVVGVDGGLVRGVARRGSASPLQSAGVPGSLDAARSRLAGSRGASSDRLASVLAEPPSAGRSRRREDSTGSRDGPRPVGAVRVRRAPARLADAHPEDPRIDLERARRSRSRRPRHRPWSSSWSLLVVAVFLLARRTGGSTPGSTGLTRGESGKSLEASSTPTSTRSTRSLASSTSGRPDGRPRGRSAPTAFQRVGLVRYNPFEDTGGNQSFALAMLDARRRRLGPVEPARPHRDAGLREGDRRQAASDAGLSEEETGGDRARRRPDRLGDTAADDGPDMAPTTPRPRRRSPP